MGFNKDDSLSKNEELNSFFTPEFRNRLDAIVEFNHLDHQVVKNIVIKFIRELNKDLKKQKISVSLDEQAISHIAKVAYSEELGARPVKRYIQEHITDKLSDAILFGELKNGGIVDVTCNDSLILSFSPLSEHDTTDQ
jgi:ATP-dependent Clp protease ATP-binding subunit ClpA